MVRVEVIIRCPIPSPLPGALLVNLNPNRHFEGKQLLRDSGIERALELTVSAIIKSDTDIGGTFSIAVDKAAGAGRTQGCVRRLHHLIQPVIFW